jgi:hypothetical protein
MPRGRKVSPEQIVVMLRQIEVQLTQGMSLALACKEAGISEQTSRTSASSARSSPVSRGLRRRLKPGAPITIGGDRTHPWAIDRPHP